MDENSAHVEGGGMGESTFIIDEAEIWNIQVQNSQILLWTILHDGFAETFQWDKQSLSLIKGNGPWKDQHNASLTPQGPKIAVSWPCQVIIFCK